MVLQNINTFITTKNKSSTEKTSNWTVTFPSNMISCKYNQGLKVNVISFHIQNNFYNLNELNNSFHIIIKDVDNTIIETIEFLIEHGNYSVHEFKDYINDIAILYFNLTYNKNRNKYKIINKYIDITKSIYIKPINSGLFFGFDNNIEVLITDNYVEAPYTATMTSFDKIVVNAYGMNTEKASVENIGLSDPEFEKSSILLWASRSDVPINAMIKYDNFDGGNSYSYNLYDTNINSFQIVLTDEYGRELTQALDYTMLLQFTIYEKNERELYILIEQITDYLKNIYIFFMILLEYIGLLKK